MSIQGHPRPSEARSNTCIIDANRQITTESAKPPLYGTGTNSQAGSPGAGPPWYPRKTHGACGASRRGVINRGLDFPWESLHCGTIPSSRFCPSLGSSGRRFLYTPSFHSPTQAPRVPHTHVFSWGPFPARGPHGTRLSLEEEAETKELLSGREMQKASCLCRSNPRASSGGSPGGPPARKHPPASWPPVGPAVSPGQLRVPGPLCLPELQGDTSWGISPTTWTPLSPHLPTPCTVSAPQLSPRCTEHGRG